MIKKIFTILSVIPRVLFAACFWGGIVFALCAAFYMSRSTEIKDHTVLDVRLDGLLVEGAEVDTPAGFESLMALAGMGKDVSTPVESVVRAVDAAAKDPKIVALRLRMDDFVGTNLATVERLTKALEAFRQTGKPIWVWRSAYGQNSYAIAMHATHISMPRMGAVRFTGVNFNTLYVGETLKTVGINVVTTRQRYKSALEPLLLSAPSKDNLAAQKYLGEDFWGHYLSEVERVRKLPAGKLSQSIETLEPLIQALNAGKTSGAFYKDLGLVDKLESREDFVKSLEETFSPTKKREDYRRVGLITYLHSLPEQGMSDANGVVVLTLSGEIGGSDDNLNARAVRRAVEDIEKDEKIKAVVLRINSPGGSAEESDEIYSALATLKQKRPVVVSMGGFAASGGYWISMAADKIVASPFTITGSIGVFAFGFEAPELLKRLKVGSGGYQSVETGIPVQGTAFSEQDRAFLSASVNNMYQHFLEHVAEHRGMSKEAVGKVAEGRVWTGTQAKERGLVDEVGGLDEAVRLAKNLAKLPESAPVVYYDASPSSMLQILKRMIGRGGARLATQVLSSVFGLPAMKSENDVAVRLPSIPSEQP